MTDADTVKVIIDKLDSQGRVLEQQSRRLHSIEQALVSIAIQDQKLQDTQRQVESLWKKYDEAFNPKDGVVTQVRNFQQSCPRAEITGSLKKQWAVIGLISTVMVGILLKAMGVMG